MIALYLSKQQALDAHPKAIQQNNFTGNLYQDYSARIFRCTFRTIPENGIAFNRKCTLAKSVLTPLGLTAAASATDAAIHKKMFGLRITTRIISSGEIEQYYENR